MYEFRFRYRFESAHRFTAECETQCSTPHGHTWYATLHLRSLDDRLNAAGMIEDFARLKAPWKTFITEVVDHSFLHHAQDPILASLRDRIRTFRGLPFPGDPTTERIARLFYEKACAMYAELLAQKKVQIDAVTIEETQTNHATYRPSAHDPLPKQGWWNHPDPMDRRLE